MVERYEFTRPLEQAVKEAHKLLLWAADSFEAHAKTADAPDEIDGCFGSAEMYREVASAIKAAMEAGR